MLEHDHLSEVIEREALVSLHQHCPENTRDALGLFVVEEGDALVCGASNDGSVLLNRTLGAGTRELVTADRLNRIHQIYETRGVSRFFVHVYPETLEGGPEVIGKTKLEKQRGWMKFHRTGESEPSDRAADLTVRKVGVDGAADFGRIVALAFGMTDAAGPLLAGLVHDQRWNLFVSYDEDGNAAGAGALMVDNGVGWLEWGATDPAFRCRGSQGAVMAARLQLAAELGCTHLFTETGEAVDGDPQHSYRNIVRYGFAESILRENWAPAR